MKLIFCVFKNLNGNKNFVVSLTSKYILKFESEERDTCELKIEDNEDYIEGFFEENEKIDIYGIVGENGVGKTSILKNIVDIFNERGSSTSENIVTMIFEDNSFENRFSYYQRKTYITNLKYKNFDCEVIDSFKDIKKSLDVIFFEPNVAYDNFYIKGDFVRNISDYGIDGLTKDLLKDKDIKINRLAKNFKNENKLVLTDLYRHINQNIIDNYIILMSRVKVDNLEAYFNEKKSIGLRPYKLDEYVKGDFSNNKSIDKLINYITLSDTKREDVDINIENDFEELNLRELTYCIATATKWFLCKNQENYVDVKNKKLFIELISHLFTDFFMIMNISDSEGIENRKFLAIKNFKDVLNYLEKFSSVNEIKYFKDVFLGRIKYIENVQEVDEFKKRLELILLFYNNLEKHIDAEKGDDEIISVNYKDETIVDMLLKNTILLKYFKIYIKPNFLDSKQNMIEYPFSAGELHLLRLVSRITYSIIDLSEKGKKNILVLLDEPDTSLHPEWQREFLDKIISSIGSVGSINKVDIQILFTTHSPIMITDVPKQNLNIFKNIKQVDDEDSNEETEKETEKETREMTEETFGNNIYSLYRNTFFLTQPMGAFAIKKINSFYKDYKIFIYESDEIDNKKEKLLKMKKVAKIVGEPYIKNDMRLKIEQISAKVDDLEDDLKDKDKNDFEDLISTLSDKEKYEILQRYKKGVL